MKRLTFRFSIVMVGLILVAIFTILVWGTLSSGDVYAHSICDLETIKGTYIFEAQGVIVDEDENVLPYAEAGIWTLDGEGNAAGVISVGIDGKNLATKEDFTAKYDLVADLTSTCVYEVTDDLGLVVDLYTTPSGEIITYYSPGFSGTQFRQ